MGVLEFVYEEILRPKPLKALANAVLRSLIPGTVRVHGATVVLNPADPVISSSLMLRSYERAETRFFRRVYRPGMTFLDIGANVGYYTALALQISSGTGKVIALEPDPESFKYLQETVKRNDGREAFACRRRQAGNASSYFCTCRRTTAATIDSTRINHTSPTARSMLSRSINCSPN